MYKLNVFLYMYQLGYSPFSHLPKIANFGEVCASKQVLQQDEPRVDNE